MYFHSIPYLHQCFGDVALPGSDACPYLAQAVSYQLSGFYMAVAHYIRIVDYIYVFPQLVGTDGGVWQQDSLLLLSVGQGDADVEAAFQQSFRVVETGADVQSSGVQVYAGRKIVQLCGISEESVLPRLTLTCRGILSPCCISMESHWLSATLK